MCRAPLSNKRASPSRFSRPTLGCLSILLFGLAHLGCAVRTLSPLDNDAIPPDATLNDFEAEYDQAVCASMTCAGQTPPEIGQPLLKINGQVVDLSTEARVGDQVSVLIPYSDVNCDVACGSNSCSCWGPGGGHSEGFSLPSNLPCSTDEGGVYLGCRCDTWEPGTLRFSFFVEDSCGGRSNTVEGIVYVVY